MLRPERMTSASIVCVRQNVEPVLEALSSFGEFHIEQTVENADISDYNQSIQKVEESKSNVNELTKQLCQEKSGFLDIFKIVEPPRTQVTSENWQALSISTSQQISALKEQVDGLNLSLSSLQEKTALLNHTKDMLSIMDRMHVDLAVLRDAKLIHIAVACVPHKSYEPLKKSLRGLPLILNCSALSKEADFIFVAISCKHGSEADKILKMHHGEILTIPQDLPNDINEALRQVDNQLKENSEKEEAILGSLSKLGDENKLSLAVWKEINGNILELLNAKKKILESGRLATVTGFVPKKQFGKLAERVRDMLGEKAIVLETEVAQAQDPPTKISNNRFVKPFEEVTKLYGLPHYDEVDPTPVMAISFPILFGLMFGDIGHGLILLVGGLTLGLLIKKGQAIKNLCWIMSMCGVAAIIAGALYGEFFGKELFPPLWFSPFQNVFDFLVFSLIIGVVQIVSGLVLEMVNFLLKHNVADAILTSIPKIGFYLGSVFVIIVYKLNIGLWFSGPILLIIVPFILMIIAKPIFLTVAKKPSPLTIEAPIGEPEGHEETLGQRLFESGDLMTRLLSNTISYSRILALLMAHWALVLVTYTVAGLVGSASILGLILSGIVIVGGNIFVIALEGLIVFIHTLRLHFYEWFSKFYGGTGTEFHPFKQNFVYTQIVLRGKEA
jgi:V/A-type H+-transporting ATPase subunit I